MSYSATLCAVLGVSTQSDPHHQLSVFMQACEGTLASHVPMIPIASLRAGFPCSSISVSYVSWCVLQTQPTLSLIFVRIVILSSLLSRSKSLGSVSCLSIIINRNCTFLTRFDLAYPLLTNAKIAIISKGKRPLTAKSKTLVRGGRLSCHSSRLVHRTLGYGRLQLTVYCRRLRHGYRHLDIMIIMNLKRL